MNRSQQQTMTQLQTGVGLVEIMISLAIGLMVLGALTYLMIGGRKSSQTQDELSRMQESGRYALDVIGKAIRQSGYRLDIANPLSGNAIEGINGAGMGANAKPDTITLRRDPAWVKDAHNSLKGEEANCAGGVIISDNDLDPKTGSRPVNSQLLVTTFSIDKGELRCATISPSGKPTSAVLVSQIENLQIEYGIAPVKNGKVNSYESANAVKDFSLVSAVRVSLLVKGTLPNTAAGQKQTYSFNGETKAASDDYLRQVYTATFALRNPVR